MDQKFQVQLKIRKPAAEAFAAVVEPRMLSSYFVQSTTGPLVEGTTVQWSFAEAPRPMDVTVHELVPNQKIVLEWQGGRGYATRVEMAFVPIDDQTTMVQITESGWRLDVDGLQSACGNAGGWMHMMACLKARLEYDINLRAGGAL